MPTISWFYGIAIQMFYNDPAPPHLHARYGRAKALVRLSDGEIIAESCRRSRPDLFAIGHWRDAQSWRRARAHIPLEKVAGPDADE